MLGGNKDFDGCKKWTWVAIRGGNRISPEAEDSLNKEKDCIGLLRINAMNFESLDRGI